MLEDPVLLVLGLWNVIVFKCLLMRLEFAFMFQDDFVEVSGLGYGDIQKCDSGETLLMCKFYSSVGGVHMCQEIV